MNRGILLLGVGLLLVAAGPSAATVNCKQVNKYLQTGRSVKDVAETMVIGEDEVKKCQDEAGNAAKGGDKPADKGAAAGNEGTAK
jgi:hypothetical protein